MFYISIPVHENISVIIDQCMNFLKYADCKIVIHVSKNSYVDNVALHNLLVVKGLNGRVLLNPYRVDTSWGGIVRSHIQNIRYILSIEKNLSVKVAFHASNDLLIRTGLDSYVCKKDFLYHTRRYGQPGLWWPSKIAFQDKCLLNLLKVKHCDYIVASQIEGSVYTLDFLKNAVRIIDDFRLLDSDKFYPREEVFFSTIAEILGVSPCCHPYVFSEVHRYDAKLWSLWKISKRIFNPLVSTIINKFFDKAFSVFGVGGLRISDINSIRNNVLPELVVYDNDYKWIPYISAGGIFGVKRVPRQINNNLRKFINALD